jgi:CIC family chloride channel protein
MFMLNLLRQQIRRLPKGARAILLTCVFGLGAGLATVAFQLVMNLLFEWGIRFFARAEDTSLGEFALTSLGIMVGTSLVAGWLLRRFCPEAAGSGIPQMKLAFWKDFGHVPFRVIWVKFIAGVLTIGGGASLGREGPSVQLAGAVGSNLAALLGEAKQKRRESAAAGAASGLAAAFNTPLASITFVLEEIIGDLNSRFLGSVLLASVLGAFVVQGIIGPIPAFKLPQIQPEDVIPTYQGYALTPLVALLASLVGVQFQRSCLRLRSKAKRWRFGNSWAFPVVGALITWMLGISVFVTTGILTEAEGRLGVFGLGYEDLTAALEFDSPLIWKVALLLLLGKFVATVACYGTGGCGGIFSPTLFFGAMTGLVVAGGLAEVGHLVGVNLDLAREDILTLVVVGMSACLGAVVWAPVTGILIVFEMTHEFRLVPALMLGALVSSWISRRFNSRNFYEGLLEQDGHEVEHVRPPRDLTEWQQLPVSAIANFKPVLMGDLAPEKVIATLRDYPYERFPVVIERQLKGVLTREEAELARKEEREPKLEPAATCRPKDSIRRLQRLLIDSSTGLVALVDRPGGKVIGIVTLHDLLRAQTQVAAAQED